MDGEPPNVVDGPLVERLRELCALTARSLEPGPAADGIAEVTERLAEPTLRLAVGGRIKAGKSTLVNALLGQRLAATAATECTRLVTWFRDSHVNRIEVRRHDGRITHVPGRPGGGVPDDLTALGAPREEIAEITVEVANDRLATEYTLVDTPGLDALSGLDPVSTAALSRADALLYVTPHPGENDLEALEALRRKADEHITVLNVIGVLSRIDELGEGTGDPWPDARKVAARYADKLSGVAAQVIPVAGLLAEAVLGDHYTETDTGAITRLAATDAFNLEEALFSVDSFRGWDTSPIGATDRDRLLRLLGRYGIGIAVAAARAGHTTSLALLAELRAHSGVDDLLTEIRKRFGYRADRLRAASAARGLAKLCDLGRDTRETVALQALRAGLTDLRRHPLMRQATLAPALAGLSAGTVHLHHDADYDALLRLATGANAAACLGVPPHASRVELLRAADREIQRWQPYEHSSARRRRLIGQAARELSEAFYFDIEDGR